MSMKFKCSKAGSVMFASESKGASSLKNSKRKDMKMNMRKEHLLSPWRRKIACLPNLQHASLSYCPD